MKCPVCENEPKNQQKCEICGWEFIYFTDEPTASELEEYTTILQNYRTEFYYNLAQQYYNNKQYEETIQCCFICCEKQMFENPLILLGLTYQLLANNEEALKYTQMSLEINPNNEIAKQLLSELDRGDEESKEIVILTDTILRKDSFETKEEFCSRIEQLGYVDIGRVGLDSYSADTEIFDFWCELDSRLNYAFIKFVPAIYKWTNREINYRRISIPRDEAKLLGTNSTYRLLATIKFKNNVFEFQNLKFEKYNFYNKAEEDSQRKKVLAEKNEKLRKENTFFNKLKKGVGTYISDRV